MWSMAAFFLKAWMQPGKKYTGALDDFAPEMQKRALEK